MHFYAFICVSYTYIVRNVAGCIYSKDRLKEATDIIFYYASLLTNGLLLYIHIAIIRKELIGR